MLVLVFLLVIWECLNEYDLGSLLSKVSGEMLSRLFVVFFGQAAKFSLDCFLRFGVEHPSILTAAVSFGVALSPGKKGKKTFDFALSLAGFLPATARCFGIPGRRALAVERAFDQAQADLNPADDLNVVERAREYSELNGFLDAFSEVGEIKGVVTATFDASLSAVLVTIAPHTAAMFAAFTSLGSSDCIETFFKVSDNSYQPGQGVGGKLARPADMDVKAAGWVYPMTFVFEHLHNRGDRRQRFGSIEYWADDFAGVPILGWVDRLVAFGGPARRQVRDLDSATRKANAQAQIILLLADQVVGGDGLDLDSESQMACFDHDAVPGIPISVNFLC